jgi:hypothetical protein
LSKFSEFRKSRTPGTRGCGRKPNNIPGDVIGMLLGFRPHPRVPGVRDFRNSENFDNPFPHAILYGSPCGWLGWYLHPHTAVVAAVRLRLATGTGRQQISQRGADPADPMTSPGMLLGFRPHPRVPGVRDFREYHPRISLRLVGVVSSPTYRGGRCCTPSSDDGDWYSYGIAAEVFAVCGVGM